MKTLILCLYFFINPFPQKNQSDMNYKELKEIVVSKGFSWFENDIKPFNLNIVSIRTSKFTNRFNDTLYVAYRYLGKEYIFEFNCTTSAGSTTITPYSRIALLKEGQYRNSFTIRKHDNRYLALCQKWDVKLPVERYRLINNKITKIGDYNDGKGLNLHRASKHRPSKEVNRWSEGCTVINHHNEFLLFMHLVSIAKEIWGNSFTYTVIEDYENNYTKSNRNLYS